MSFVEKTAASKPQPHKLFKATEPYNEGYLEVSANPPHRMYYAQYGNPKGEPILYLHGGPGAGITPSHLQLIDPKRYRIIAFDQRGCGKSTFGAEQITADMVAQRMIAGNDVHDEMTAMLADNTTDHLIEDVEALRNHLGFKPAEKMPIFAGSWGTTLALAYAIKHPENVASMVLRGIYLSRKQDNQWTSQGNAANTNDTTIAGAYHFFPDAWKQYVAFIPPEERGDMAGAYLRRMRDGDNATRIAACQKFQLWEDALSWLHPQPPETLDGNDALKAIPCSGIELTYTHAGCFMPDNYIIDHLDRITHIPTTIIHGRYDTLTPLNGAVALAEKWKELDPEHAPKMVITTASHAALDEENKKALLEATNPHIAFKAKAPLER